jgi:hypothetical protein
MLLVSNLRIAAWLECTEEHARFDFTGLPNPISLQLRHGCVLSLGSIVVTFQSADVAI